MRWFFILLTMICLSVSCSKKVNHVEQKYKLEEIKKLAHEASELPKKIEEGGIPIPLAEYSPGVIVAESFGMKYKRLVFFLIAFETEEMARNEAIRLNQYYVRNWLIDRVEGEPVLEDYVIEALKASNPNRLVQRVPKHSTKDSHSSTSENHH